MARRISQAAPLARAHPLGATRVPPLASLHLPKRRDTLRHTWLRDRPPQLLGRPGMEIDGHGVVVTGGASGLGEATARHLADLGADVTILDIDGARAADIAAQINGYSLHCD